MNAIELLSEQQHAVDQLLDAVDRTDADDHARLRELAGRLAAHLRTEEETLYPIARTASAAVALDEGTVSAQILRRISDATSEREHEKLATLMSLAEEQLDGAYDAYDDLVHHAIDDEALERIGAVLADRFESGIRMAALAAPAARRRRAARRPVRAAARRRRSG